VDGLRAWREALTPLNLVVGLPARALRGDEPPPDAVRSAASRYLKLQPDGPLAEESLDWMRRADLSRTPRRRDAAWDDGRLVLPPARTPYPRILGRPILVTNGLVQRAGISDLLEEAGDADALVLATSPQALAGGGRPLDRDVALVMLRELARGLDTGDVRPFGRNRSAAAEAIRRFDGAIRSGRAQAWVTAWSEQVDRGSLALRDLMADGAEHRVARVDLERGSKRLRASRTLLGGAVSCPAQLVCMDRDRAWSSRAFAEVGPDGSVRLSTRASFHDLAISIELDELVPKASVSIPIARWLRIDRWLPLGARLGIGLDGISFGPTIRKIEAPLHTAEE
jgi:hypothetical protein